MHFDRLKRREFITLLAGTVAWPLAARAQQPERIRRIGVLMNLAADDPQAQVRLAAFQQALQQLGWSDGRNVRIDIRRSENDADRARKYAQELVALAPDILLADSTLSVTALLYVTHTLPIVFAIVADPVGAGFVDSLSRPGGNITGFMIWEYSFSGKWLELLKQIAPQVTRAAVIRDPALTVGTAVFSAIQAVAPSLGVEVTPIGAHDVGAIERAVEAFARSANGGLIVTGTGLMPAVTRDLIITLAARHKLPAVYPFRDMVTAGGLVSYGSDLIDQFRRAAGYVDRILKGEKPADLPVQAPTKYELVVNLKTAKAIGLDVPATVLARADEVIE
jgi:putative ABC transport system substrate-binding protein